MIQLMQKICFFMQLYYKFENSEKTEKHIRRDIQHARGLEYSGIQECGFINTQESD